MRVPPWPVLWSFGSTGSSCWSAPKRHHQRCLLMCVLRKTNPPQLLAFEDLASCAFPSGRSLLALASQKSTLLVRCSALGFSDVCACVCMCTNKLHHIMFRESTVNDSRCDCCGKWPRCGWSGQAVIFNLQREIRGLVILYCVWVFLRGLFL